MVERYRVVAPGDYGAEEHPEGEYVKHEDYASLSSQHAEAVARVEALERELNIVYGGVREDYIVRKLALGGMDDIDGYIDLGFVKASDCRRARTLLAQRAARGEQRQGGRDL